MTGSYPRPQNALFVRCFFFENKSQWYHSLYAFKAFLFIFPIFLLLLRLFPLYWQTAKFPTFSQSYQIESQYLAKSIPTQYIWTNRKILNLYTNQANKIHFINWSFYVLCITFQCTRKKEEKKPQLVHVFGIGFVFKEKHTTTTST